VASIRARLRDTVQIAPGRVDFVGHARDQDNRGRPSSRSGRDGSARSSGLIGFLERGRFFSRTMFSRWRLYSSSSSRERFRAMDIRSAPWPARDLISWMNLEAHVIVPLSDAMVAWMRRVNRDRMTCRMSHVEREADDRSVFSTCKT